jgi:hypothetical protein
MVHEIQIGYFHSQYTAFVPSKLTWTLSDHIIRFGVMVILSNRVQGGLWEQSWDNHIEVVESLCTRVTEVLAYLVDKNASLRGLKMPPVDFSHITLPTTYAGRDPSSITDISDEAKIMDDSEIVDR